MKVILSCGGTGGHITPALAIAATICENIPRAEILFVGGTRGLEQALVGAAGYPIRTLRVEGLSRSLSLSNLRALRLAAHAVREADAILTEFAPDIVIGTGGYACFPTLRAAARRGIPTAVHESNAVPGLSVRLLAARLDRVWLNFEAAAEQLPKRASTLVVGNPLTRVAAQARPYPLPTGCRQMVLSFGGSLGAPRINRAVLELMKREADHPEIYHLHAAGKADFEATDAAFRAAGLARIPRLRVVPFLTDMPRQMAGATVVVCRAGAMSISELAAMGRAAVLIPSPNVTGNHQYRNAKALADAGAAVLLTEDQLDRETLTRAVLELLSDGEKRGRMERAVRAFARPEANRRILDDIRRLTGK
ncbi:MAG: UDP-N-acetylglucosamine--N-acetylmuramyl-(pentapeptide) pyrophosphoryl-undecaprenol N-acetylglucosamine transferase [Clostridia bacterium]|nr:UDP-N-acetylglucosamine--N-acetylmuramyl-(pentapeptide) pyrophosphoryl-undecaprenol N-acetylglucosamine transferase [Clostridia bacterium]